MTVLNLTPLPADEIFALLQTGDVIRLNGEGVETALFIFAASQGTAVESGGVGAQMAGAALGPTLVAVLCFRGFKGPVHEIFDWALWADWFAQLDRHEMLGVCLDTCHLLTAGYDICSAEGYAQTFAEFERALKHPRCHLFFFRAG